MAARKNIVSGLKARLQGISFCLPRCATQSRYPSRVLYIAGRSDQKAVTGGSRPSGHLDNVTPSHGSVAHPTHYLSC